MRVEDLRVVEDFKSKQIEELAVGFVVAATRPVSVSEVADALRNEGYLVIPTPWPEWAVRQTEIVVLERLWAAAALAESSKGVE